MRREFFAKNYASIKAANTKLPILLRECSGTAAKATATYGALKFFFSAHHPLVHFAVSRQPCFPFEARACSFSDPPLLIRCAARASSTEYGVEKAVDLEGLSADAVSGEVTKLMKGS